MTTVHPIAGHRTGDLLDLGLTPGKRGCWRITSVHPMWRDYG